MKRSRLNSLGGFFLAALLSSPALGSIPPQPGTVNYVEGQVAIGARPLAQNAVGSAALAAGQSLSTDNGRAEILLTPGIFLRLDAHSAVQMVTPGLADTSMTLQKGRALVDAAGLLPANNVRIGESGASVQIQKAGLYEFDADHSVLRVFDGKAVVQVGGRSIEVTSAHQLILNAAGKLKAEKFDRQQFADDFYRWASLRSSYEAEANVDAARRYAGGSGYSSAMWYGAGWYWNPWYSAYTFIPGEGIFYDPFGWGFYSPWMAFGAPYFGFGYGFGGYGYGGGYYRHFGPGFQPALRAGVVTPGAVGHAYTAGGFASMARVGAYGGGGFHGGGFAGGGFHGGGGGGRR